MPSSGDNGKCNAMTKTDILPFRILCEDDQENQQACRPGTHLAPKMGLNSRAVRRGHNSKRLWQAMAVIMLTFVSIMLLISFLF